VLNSGNAVLSSPVRGAPTLAADVAASLLTQFGVATPVIVKTAKAWAAIVAENPIVPASTDPGQHLVVVSMDADALQALAPLKSLLMPGERFEIGAHAAYLDCAEGLLTSPAAAALLGKGGRQVTTRNWNTTLKLLQML
jgi:uncharacterized protein (DUF1697 family)